MMRRDGFTLAEVLITLGIIGVVAAMTIPTLISNTNGAQFKTAYKKALSTLNQAVLMNVALADSDFASIDGKETAATDTDYTANTLSKILQDRVAGTSNTSAKYFDAVGSSGLAVTDTAAPCTGAGTPNSGCTDSSSTYSLSKTYTSTTAKVFSFTDGTSFGYLIADKNCTKTAPCYGFIDVNGANGPNTQITDAETVQDVYPVLYYDQTVEPATDAAREVLFGK
ncbi:type II secretion system protein [bacterium]|nr:type II secretion system protein [bacterium]